jgi:hypothetical protein
MVGEKEEDRRERRDTGQKSEMIERRRESSERRGNRGESRDRVRGEGREERGERREKRGRGGVCRVCVGGGGSTARY